jgi:hypothetical protein
MGNNIAVETDQNNRFIVLVVPACETLEEIQNVMEWGWGVGGDRGGQVTLKVTALKLSAMNLF